MNRGSEADDADVIRAICSGDAELFRVLVERHQGATYALILRQVGDAAVAEDLLQDAFLRAFKGLKSFRHGASFKTWITRIALNVTNSYFSSRAYKQKSSQVPLDLERHDGPADPYDWGTEKKLRVLQQALGRLSERYREVLALCLLEGRSYDEASQILGIPIGTVGSRINKAIALLHLDFMKMVEDENG